MKTLKAFNQFALFLFVGVFVILSSCQNKVSPSPTELTDSAVAQINSIEDSSIQTTTFIKDSLADKTNFNDKNQSNFNLSIFSKKGELEKSFEDIYTNCMKASNDPSAKKLIYFTTSNTKSIGTIYSSDGKSLLNSFYKCFLDSNSNIDSLTANKEVKKFTEFNNSGTCDYNVQKNHSLALLVNGSLPYVTDADLSTNLTGTDSIVLKGYTWSRIDIDDSLFAQYLNESTNSNVIQYRNSVTNSGNLVLTTVFKISGFSGDIYKKSGFSAGLAAQLQASKVSVPATSDTSSHALQFKLTMSTGNNQVIHVSSTGEFYIFGIYKAFSSK